MLVIAAVTAVIAAGFLFRSSQEAKMATRSFYDAVALNLAEGAIEEALYSLNSGNASTANGWTVPADSSTALVKSITSGFTFQQATGGMYLRIDGANTATPVLTAASVVTLQGQNPIVKQIRITGTKRQVWSGGVVAKSGVTMTGTNVIDGFDSTKGAYNTSTNRTDRGSICAVSVSCTGSGSVYGYATHRADSDWPSSCSVRGATTPNGTNVDSTRVRTDYSVNLTNSTPPSSSRIELNHINSAITLPRTGDHPDATTGRYRYHCSGIDLHNSDAIWINDLVDLVSDGDANFSDHAQIIVGATYNSNRNNFGYNGNGNHYGWGNNGINTGNLNAHLSFYTSHNIDMEGDGVNNLTGTPGNATIWGTCTSNQTQSVKFKCGGANHQVALYCPNASVECDDDEIHGSVICNTLRLTGTAKCHYDTQLANIASDPNGDKNSLAVSTLVLGAWAELKKSALTGSGASGTVTVATGTVTGVTIVNGGTNYTASSPVQFTGGGGTGATGTVTVSNGVVTGVTITNAGTGYTTSPTLTIGDPFARDNRAPFTAFF